MRIPGGVCFLGLTMVSLLAMPGAVEALCMDGVEAPLPTKVTFDRGDIVEVLQRDAYGMRYTSSDSDTGRVIQTRVEAGVFVTGTVSDGKWIVFDWSTPLPSMQDLVVGASFDATAAVTYLDRDPSEFRVVAEVLREDVVRLDDCSYPVLVIDVQNFDTGKHISTVTKYLHVASQISLGTVIQSGDNLAMNIAVQME